MRDSAGNDAILCTQLTNIVGRRLPFYRRVGGEDHLGERLRFQTLLQPVKTDIIRANTVQR
ncbi:hypothetical protein D3C75_1317930 [compost metagenome]